MLQQIRDRRSETRVRLHFPLIKLCFEPNFQLFHQRPAVCLVKGEALLGRHVLLACRSIVHIDFTKYFQHEPALVGKVGRHLYESPRLCARQCPTMISSSFGRLRDNAFQQLGDLAQSADRGLQLFIAVRLKRLLPRTFQ
jgi:hypothetical protein